MSKMEHNNPAELSETSFPILPLEQITEVDRPVSPIEYYHASVGKSKKTLDRSRECILIMPGTGTIDEADLRQAVAAVADVNPGTRLRWQGRRQKSRWVSDGPLPNVRVIEDCEWDAGSDLGSEFLYEFPLTLEGPNTELLIIRGAQNCIVLRTLHAIMDGFGMLHFLQEIFRALRGEPLVGSNAEFSDFDLINEVPSHKDSERRKDKERPAYSTGGPDGNRKGDMWQLVKLDDIPPKALVTVMRTIAEYAAEFSDQPCVIALPISLRRHLPQINSTANYASMVHIEVDKHDSLNTIKNKVNEALELNADTNFPKQANIIKYFPLRLLDRLLSRTNRNFRKRKVVETCVISKLGYFNSADYTGGGFTPERLYTIPVEGNTMISISSLDTAACFTIGMEKVYATNWRFERLKERIQEALNQQIVGKEKIK